MDGIIDNGSSLVRLEKWKAKNNKIYTLNRCVYTAVGASMAMHSDGSSGPDLYVIIENAINETVAILWHPTNMPQNIKMIYKNSKSVILDKKCSLDRIREVFSIILASEDLNKPQNLRIIQSSSQRNTFWHVLR